MRPRLGSLRGAFWAALWYALSLATRSVESLAALSERVLGMVKRADANSAMASCSLDPCDSQHGTPEGKVSMAEGIGENDRGSRG